MPSPGSRIFAGHSLGIVIGFAAALTLSSGAFAQSASSAAPVRLRPVPQRRDLNPVVSFSVALGTGALFLTGGILTLALTHDPGAIQQPSEHAYFDALDAAHWQHVGGGILLGVGCGGLAIGALGLGLVAALHGSRGAVLSSLRWGVVPMREGAMLSVGFATIGL